MAMDSGELDVAMGRIRLFGIKIAVFQKYIGGIFW